LQVVHAFCWLLGVFGPLDFRGLSADQLAALRENAGAILRAASAALDARPPAS
jgi:hypothetical protein